MTVGAGTVAQQEIDPQAVIEGLTTQIGQLTTQIIMRDVALAAVRQELADLKASSAPAETA